MRPFPRFIGGFALLFAMLPIDAGEQYFAEPYSGKKVAQYQIDLPVGRNQRQSFNVPEDCNGLIRHFDNGASQWGQRVERSIWSKVRNDCEYHAFLNQFSPTPGHDFVSGYDFLNADFNDLPIEEQCDPLTQGPECIPMPDGIRPLGTFIPFLNPQTADHQELSGLCKFKDGLFRGRLLITPSGLRCQPDARAPGCRVIAIDHADVNGDGYQDVVLKLIPLGPSRNRTPLILPLTRTGEDQKFTIPEGVVLPNTQH